MTRMMLTLRTKLTRWGTLRAFVRQYKPGRAVTLFHDSSAQCGHVKNAYLMIWMTFYDLYCHTVQNRCILSLVHLCWLLDDYNMICVCCFPQLMEVTGKNQDECMVALHDCNEDVSRAINFLLESTSDMVNYITSHFKLHLLLRLLVFNYMNFLFQMVWIDLVCLESFYLDVWFKCGKLMSIG